MDYKELFENEPSFLRIAEHYYDKNFGTMSKSEMDLLMFYLLYQRMKDANEHAPSDFELAKILGITNKRVRNMIEKMELKYPSGEDKPWQEKIRELFKTPAFQQGNGKDEIVVLIKDVMLRYEVEAFLDSNYLPTEYTLNSQVILLRKAALCALVYECCSDDDKNEILAKMKLETEIGELEIKKEIGNHSWWNRLGHKALSEAWDICKNIIINIGTNIGTSWAVKSGLM